MKFFSIRCFSRSIRQFAPVVAAILSLSVLPARVNSNDNFLHDLEPQLSGRLSVARQHYARRGYQGLAGQVDSLSFSASRPLLIDTVTIPRGIEVTLGPDSRVCCEPGAVLIVQGTLRVEGAKGHPVVFCPVDSADLLYKVGVKPGTWDGIKVLSDGTMVLVEAVIDGATNGVVADGACSNISVKNLAFVPAGAGRLTVDGALVASTGDAVYNLNCMHPGKTESRVPAASVPRVVSTVFLGAGVVAAIAGVILEIAGSQTDQKVDGANSHGEAQNYHDRATALYKGGSISLAGSGALLAPGIVIRVVLHSKKHGKNHD